MCDVHLGSSRYLMVASFFQRHPQLSPSSLPSAWCVVNSRCTQGMLKDVPRREAGMAGMAGTADTADTVDTVGAGDGSTAATAATAATGGSWG